ncbi:MULTISPECIES: 5-(carboxyamino)imidazole ribonucleotide synthase [Desertifilum]|uniref:N5-carboxyaminoimidazole ribonucleotide synthase n=1 Tax=Desertifilum tharense IPPAS B-1220 TaxID=1781255 RepID=A0A1E5QEV0_9CYAN|nr:MULTISPECIES: 5-(carboxyamino)imidazole ribonucleotide synthase [Desertifilum]MDA0208894.1 5-(carboxyamino)imidazole ribonucleotide synthase [Cyanobacteria bacterium FC1]OEJ73202.1 5-(carboxyamino)imidazole ribonucleotide synthase [Desertifilum tharense IPPAS B-1220]
MSKQIQRVGVIGGGQLAWMMAGAAQKLGVELIVQTPSPDDPAVATAADAIFAPVDDASATSRLAERCDAITFENEFIDLAALQPLASRGVEFRPRLAALAPLLDKYEQRRYLREIGLPVPEFVAVERDNLQLPNPRSPFPTVLKARRHGYDGQGTFILRDRTELETALNRLGNTPTLLEAFVPFERELAVITARDLSGEVRVFPVVETQQVEQVCRWVYAPAEVSVAVWEQVEAIATTLLNALEVVGVFGIELFLTPDGQVLVNEIAPRTHNSGHLTLDACHTSQFEQQLRAVCQQPLGDSGLNCPGAVMVNLLGYEQADSEYLPQRQQLAEIPQSHVYWYGKNQARPGRKLGHVTVLLETGKRSEAIALIEKIEAIWYPPAEL